MGALLSRITMSAIIGALVAGGLVYLNMSQGMGRLADQTSGAATAEALEAMRAENAAILGDLENDIAEIAADLMAVRQNLAAEDAYNSGRFEDMAAALAAIQDRLETPLAAPPANPAAPQPAPVEQ
ncbi:hypothetical protein LGT41_0008520 [Abyssibius alkaniclasticus]|uniref:hypothetical protein n=1 Tax=Abyssibius alkaniclasticus TaxID=2881234 RepID=UPI0023634079|nr:hypothetical protein [Abyssibius alkaniclasticus]UPH69868.1 hypothetical protein LGT41_0008520 [Abyssibius alkaniclasticus]